MSDNVNIIVQDTINEIVVNTAVVVETIDINVQVAVDEVNIIANPNNYVVNINRIIGEQVQSDWDQNDDQEPDYIKNKPSIPTLTSDLINDGEDGINPFITANDLTPQVNSDWNATSGVAQILNKPSIPSIDGLATVVYVDQQDALKVDKVAGSRLITSAESTLLGNTSGINTGDQDLSNLVVKNTAIVGATKTKITYDAKGLVTSGADATTADIADSLDKRYVTDANLTTIGNQSGVNTGDETTATIKTKLGITTLSGSNTGDQDLSGLTPNTRSISTTTPLQGGGDLSANRTLSILQSNTTQSGFLSNTDWNTFNGKFNLPSLTSGSVLFSNGTTIAQDNANLFWDDTNNRLGIGTASPLVKLHVVGTGESEVRVSENTNNNYITLYQQALTSYLIAGRTGATSVQPLAIYTGGSEKMRIQADGNIGINTAAPTAKLAIKAGGALSTDIALRVRNSADTTDLFQVQGNGAIVLSSGASFYTVGNNLNFRSNLAGGSGYVLDVQSYNTLNSTSNEQGFGFFSAIFAPTSGTAVFNGLKITPTINQTGGANGITRGLFINPTLTAAADFRAIETTIGNVILGSTSGNVGIGTSSPSQKLQVETSVNGADGIWARNTNTGASAYGVVIANSAVGGIGLRAHSAANGAWPNTSMLHSASGFSNGLVLFQEGANPIAFWTNTNERMRITSAGNVGIGTTAPTSKLHVVGLIDYATNALAIAGGLTVGAFYHTAGVVKVVI
jgi:hypothetical protein